MRECYSVVVGCGVLRPLLSPPPTSLPPLPSCPISSPLPLPFIPFRVTYKCTVTQLRRHDAGIPHVPLPLFPTVLLRMHSTELDQLKNERFTNRNKCMGLLHIASVEDMDKDGLWTLPRWETLGVWAETRQKTLEGPLPKTEVSYIWMKGLKIH